MASTNRKKQGGRPMMIRLLAVILVVMLLGTGILVYLISALAEGSGPDRYDILVEPMEQTEALYVKQRLSYCNRTGRALECVYFSVPADLFRSESTIPYDGDTVAKAFPEGYAPGGAEILSVTADGIEADWGMRDAAQTQMRVEHAIPAGGVCAFEMEYVVVTSRNSSFLGICGGEWILAGLFVTAAPFDGDGEPVFSSPAVQTDWLYADKSVYSVTVRAPGGFVPYGSCAFTKNEDGETWTGTSEAVKEFAFALVKDRKGAEVTTRSGKSVTILPREKAGSAKSAASVIEMLEETIAPLPYDTVILETEVLEGVRVYPGLILIDPECGDYGRTLGYALCKQYFGMSAVREGTRDNWLCDAISLYLTYRYDGWSRGRGYMIERLDEDILPAMQITVPTGRRMTDDPGTMTAKEYGVTVLKRGCAVFHELASAMGEDGFDRGLAALYAAGSVSFESVSGAMNDASGTDWSLFLADWAENAEEYASDMLETLG